MVGEEEESVERDGAGTKLGSVAFTDHRLGGQALDPGQRGGVGEAEIVREEEDEVLVIGVRGEESRAGFGLVAEVVVMTGCKIALE